MSAAPFVPGNALEEVLVQALAGEVPQSEFLGTLVNGQVFVLMDKALGPGNQWDPSINLCVLANDAGTALMAVFTAPERADGFRAQVPDFAHGLLVSTLWLMKGLGPDVGLVVNPGIEAASVELTPRMIGQMKDALAAEQAALSAGREA